MATAPALIADIQVVPMPSGTAEKEFKHVEAAIAVRFRGGVMFPPNSNTSVSA